MARIKIKDYDIEIEAKGGERLSDCIRRAGIDIETPCSGMGTCGKCKVVARGDLYPPGENESRFIEGQKDVRLSCQAKVRGDVEVELIGGGGPKASMNTVNRGYSIEVDLDSRIRKVRMEAANCERGSASQPRIESFGLCAFRPEVLKKIGTEERKNSGCIHVVACGKEVIDVCGEGQKVMGVSIDIGTTGLSAYLVDLETGEVLHRVSGVNPQTQYGGDVLSRITYAMENENGAADLERCIAGKLGEMVIELSMGRCKAEDIYNIVISGNTTMLHLLLGVDPVSLARAPYRPVFLDRLDLPAGHCDIGVNESAVITILPGASGYVGADIVSGVVATGFDKKKNTSVFIDIGTNGEIVAISDSKLAATSTAAGPALEGMNISCGMRAEQGAIESFRIDDSGEFEIGVIGGGEPRGICGSGLIDIMAQILEKGIVMKSGRFNASKMDEKFKKRLEEKKFYITGEIFISQGDIRQIQLAKGAISTGVVMLLKELGIGIDQVDEAVIAGAFGYHLDPDNIRRIGLIPKDFIGKVSFVGNSSIEGARLSLLNEGVVEKMDDVANRISVLELSTSEEFQDHFVRELKF